jgi:hypothetical protein
MEIIILKKGDLLFKPIVSLVLQYPDIISKTTLYSDNDFLEYAIVCLYKEPKNKTIKLIFNNIEYNVGGVLLCSLYPSSTNYIVISYVCIFYGSKTRLKLFKILENFGRSNKYEYLEIGVIGYNRVKKWVKKLGFDYWSTLLFRVDNLFFYETTKKI